VCQAGTRDGSPLSEGPATTRAVLLARQGKGDEAGTHALEPLNPYDSTNSFGEEPYALEEYRAGKEKGQRAVTVATYAQGPGDEMG